MQRTLVMSILVSATMVAHADRPSRVVDGDSLGVVAFAPGSTRVNEAALDRVEDIAAWHAKNPDSLLIVEGHASPSGSRAKNLRLSQQRTDEVRAALLRAGADPNRIVLVAHGENHAAEASGSEPRVVIRATGDFVELAREQRDPEIGEDARAARRGMIDRRSGGVTTPSGNAGAATPSAGAAPSGNAGTTIVIIPGGSPTTAVGAGAGSFGAGTGSVGAGTGSFGAGGTGGFEAGVAGPTSGGTGTSAATGLGFDPTDQVPAAGAPAITGTQGADDTAGGGTAPPQGTTGAPAGTPGAGAVTTGGSTGAPAGTPGAGGVGAPIGTSGGAPRGTPGAGGVGPGFGPTGAQAGAPAGAPGAVGTGGATSATEPTQTGGARAGRATTRTRAGAARGGTGTSGAAGTASGRR